jgi:hypothetical protein
MAARILIALLIATAAFAEVAPEVYEEMQRKAPEVLQLEVVDVDVDRELRKPYGCRFFEFEVSRHVTVKAKVLSVVRSRSGVRAGSVIEIEYESLRQCSGWSGPRPIPLLVKKERVRAYLEKGEGGFAPAAMGASFVPVERRASARRTIDSPAG